MSSDTSSHSESDINYQVLHLSDSEMYVDNNINRVNNEADGIYETNKDTGQTCMETAQSVDDEVTDGMTSNVADVEPDL